MDTHNDNMPLWQCNTCKQYFPRTPEYWHKRVKSSDGLAHRCKECAKMIAREWARNNRERMLANKHRYYQENRIHILEQMRKHLSVVRDKKNEYRNQWRRNNPGMARAQHQRRRALKKNAVGSFSATDIQIQMRSQANRCWWCGVGLDKGWHIDHLIPLAKGGSNNPENIVISCPHCNVSRQDRLPQEWNGRLF